MIIAGVDEAGRGPVLGPLVVAGVILKEPTVKKIQEMGLKDSKQLTPEKRNELYTIIQEKALDIKVTILPAAQIDQQRFSAISLNKIEITAMIEILRSLKGWKKAYVDACDPNARRFQVTLRNHLQADVIAEHFADKFYPIVSAASVVAKVVRDQEVLKAHKEFDYDFGSGYCHDPKTNEFLTAYLKQHDCLPSIARKSWKTAKRLIRSHQQTELEEFFE
jgi:ribonuclease HII